MTMLIKSGNTMDSRENSDRPLKRFNIFLPINRNTNSHISDILSLIKNKFGGCTYSRFHLPPVSLGCRNLFGYFIGSFHEYPDEDICFITVDVSQSDYPEIYKEINAIAELINQCGEEVVWITYNDVMLCSQPQIKAT